MHANMPIHRWKQDRLKSAVVLVGLSAIVFPFPRAAAQSQLDAVRAAVRTPSSNASADSDDRGDDSWYSHHHDSCDSCDDGDGWGDILGEILGPPIMMGITAPWWGPHVALGDSFDITAFPAPYPECWRDEPGNTSCIGNFGRGKFGNVWLEYGSDFDNLERIAGAVCLETMSRWGVDAAWASYQEQGDARTCASLMTGDFNVIYRFAQSERIHLRTGLGVNWFDDASDTDFGFNFTYGGDLFLRGPWVLSTEIDWGTLHHAERFHGRATFGVAWQRIEAYGGFDYESFDAASLKSLVFGVRYWY